MNIRITSKYKHASPKNNFRYDHFNYNFFCLINDAHSGTLSAMYFSYFTYKMLVSFTPVINCPNSLSRHSF